MATKAGEQRFTRKIKWGFILPKHALRGYPSYVGGRGQGGGEGGRVKQVTGNRQILCQHTGDNKQNTWCLARHREHGDSEEERRERKEANLLKRNVSGSRKKFVLERKKKVGSPVHYNAGKPPCWGGRRERGDDGINTGAQLLVMIQRRDILLRRPASGCFQQSEIESPVHLIA